MAYPTSNTLAMPPRSTLMGPSLGTASPGTPGSLSNWGVDTSSDYVQDPGGNWVYNPYKGLPDLPGYSAAYDPAKESLSDYLTKNLDTSPLAKFRGEAMRTGPSAWAELAKGDQRAQEATARERGASEINGQTAQQLDNLAMHGGLSSGARERADIEGGKNYLSMSQDLSHQGSMNNLQIGMNDESNRIQQLSMLPGLEQSQAGMLTDARAKDIGATTAENQRRNDYNQWLSSQRQNLFATNQQAYATEHSKGSSFICSALAEQGLMSPRERVLMTRFMLRSVLPRADFFAWYFTHGKYAVEAAQRQKFDFSAIKTQFVDDILELVKAGREEEAQNLYAKRAGQFVTQWMGDLGGYSSGLEKKSLLRSVLALPLVFTLPQTWKWMSGYFGPKIKRTLSRRLAWTR